MSELIKRVQTILSQNGYINETNEYGEVLLHLAAKNNDTEAMSLLLSNGAEINIQNDFGFTPLHLAAESGHTEIARDLIKVSAKNNEWDTPTSSDC